MSEQTFYSAMSSSSTASFLRATKVTFIYIAFVVLVNTIFLVIAPIPFMGHELVVGEIVVGAIYVVRDFAQREIGHYVFIAMIAAALLSYLVADPTIALASLAAFSVGEVIDWAIFTFTKRPLSKRILLSAAVSAPIDSWIFLSMIGRLSLFELAFMSCMKILGVLILWASWKARQRRDAVQYV